MNNTKSNLINELTEGMQSLCAVANRVVATQGLRIETDLMLDNLRRLYDVVLRMQTAAADRAAESGTWPVPSPSESDEESGESMVRMSVMAATAMHEEPAPEPEPVIIPEPQPDERVEESAPEEEESTEEIAPDEEEAAEKPEPEEAEEMAQPELTFEEEEVKVITAEPEPTPMAEPDPAPIEDPTPAPAEPQSHRQASLLDYLQKPITSTLGERLSASAEKNHAGAFGHVNDLRTVINIGDRYTFVNELFGGEVEAYNHFIAELNTLSSREEALQRVETAKETYRWNDESSAVESFMRVFNKKF